MQGYVKQMHPGKWLVEYSYNSFYFNEFRSVIIAVDEASSPEDAATKVFSNGSLAGTNLMIEVRDPKGNVAKPDLFMVFKKSGENK